MSSLKRKVLKKMSILDFVGFFIDNPWLLLIIGIFVGVLMIVQLVFLLKLRQKGAQGVGFILAGFIVAVVAIILMIVFWMILWYDSAEDVMLFLICLFLLIMPIISTILVTIGIYLLSKSLAGAGFTRTSRGHYPGY
jgi:hypothetical protein